MITGPRPCIADMLESYRKLAKYHANDISAVDLEAMRGEIQEIDAMQLGYCVMIFSFRDK